MSSASANDQGVAGRDRGPSRIRFRLLQEVASFERTGDGPARIPDLNGVVLRLLILSDREGMGKHKIASRLPARPRTNADGFDPQFDPAQVSGKIHALRKKLGQPTGESKPIEHLGDGGYRFNGNRDEVDVYRFQSLIESCDACKAQSVEELESPPKAMLESLSEADQLWTSNPATPLVSLGTDEYDKWPTEIENYFRSLKQRLSRGLIYYHLRSGTRSGIVEASQQITARMKTGETEPEMWELLLRSYGSLSVSNQLDSTMAKARRVFRSHDSALQDLESIYRSVQHGDGPNTFSIERPAITTTPRSAEDGSGVDPDVASARALEPDQEAVLDVAARLGIKSESALRLDNSKLTPLDCIQRVRSDLAFSGIFASKWVTEPAIRAEFSRKLERLDEGGGTCRFLILDPESGSRQRLDDLRDGGLSSETVPRLVELANAHPSFEVRGFDSLPVFRIVMIDTEVVSFSPYLLTAAQYKNSDRGWGAPHVILDPLAKWALADGFRLYFEELWRTARILTEHNDG